MARNKRGKQKQTTPTESNTLKTSQDWESNSTDDKEFSETLSRVLDYVGVNADLIQFRRKIMLSYEREFTLIYNAFGSNRRGYIFGSQIEGTTTIGMMSDRDQLQRFDLFRLFLDSENPHILPHDHQVVIKVSTHVCASQYCVLTMIEPSTQARRFQPLDPYRDPFDIVNFFKWDWTTTDGMIHHKGISVIQNQLPLIRMLTERHGPAQNIWNIDNIYACYCKSLPKQCKFIFERPRPGHWPSGKTLKKAKKYGIFIVPQGPPKHTNICTYDYFDYQWRISTNLTERLLMFSLDTVHLKAYVLIKMLRTELFMPEYQNRLSTFHLKTALFFAVENTRPDVWREDNLINCVKYILVTFRRFLKRRNCPHFTIANVNLFDGKMERHEFQKLVNKLTFVMNSIRTKIEQLQMDNIGTMLNERSTTNSGQNIYCTNNSALFNYVCNIFQGGPHTIDGFEFSGLSVSNRIAVFEQEFMRFEMYYRTPLNKYRTYDYGLHSFISGLASFGASAYLEQKTKGREYNHDGINKARQMFIQSLQSDIIGYYMRYASFLFCNGDYDEACTYFDLIETKIEEDKKTNLIYLLCHSPSEALTLQIAKQSYLKSVKQRFSVFVTFRQTEAMCVPEFLRCEMYRWRFGTNTSSDFRIPFYSNEDCICALIEPYLYYIQYLTYRELHQERKRSDALEKILKFTTNIKFRRVVSSNGDMFQSFDHFDTSLNILGHCFELEQNFVLAWITYILSLRMLPQRNAAVLHIIRLLWQVYQLLRT
ncbi:uncharacterized protein LOC127856299 isoform X2 [Dreissena polymorpha]|nr:uncharacterized protein LOC127856299 isoform X2 [Dreissena polymorpha]XP_052248378.1 uncharacterized protein LOC127856299 isoform X2 [Dreissena polymorpha]